LNAGAGADSIDGGLGVDTLTFVGSAAGVTANLALGLGAGGDAAGDRYGGIENVIGSNSGDVLVGAPGVANALTGGVGDDTFYADQFDVLSGGAGKDVLFGGQGGALNINLSTTSIETAWGSVAGDNLDGSSATVNLIIVGQGGADTMKSGGGDDFLYFDNRDVVSGGAGSDWAWAFAGGGGAITLNTTTAAIEKVWGSTFGDSFTAAGSASTAVLVGDLGNDTLTGGNAGDFLYGQGGNDVLNGGRGNDNLIGDLGADTFAFSANWGSDIVWGWLNGAEKFDLRGSGVTAFSQLTVNQNLGGSGDALISFGTNRILVVDGANQIDAGDFLV
jgi:Ca2+-binding RTX toxin-like protein